MRDLLGDLTYRLLALFGQNFAEHFLSQSTHWLDSIIFAAGPLGVPAAVVAAIRVRGYDFLKGAIGRAGEKESSVEKDLLSSTSKKVCELWDGEKVVRLEETGPFIKQLIYSEGIWYNLSRAVHDILEEKGKKKSIKSLPGDVEKGKSEEKSEDTFPSNISLNLIPESRSRELPPAAILGILLQLTVLIIAGLTTFHPHWKGKFSVQLYEFYCMAGGTVLLSFGLTICVSVVDQRTKETTYKTREGKTIQILWLQRGRTDSDQSFKPCIFEVKRKTIRTSLLKTEYKDFWEAMTLLGTLATMLGYILQFIGLVGMHWPTQVAQFSVTLIMTGVRVFIRRAPPTPGRYPEKKAKPKTIPDRDPTIEDKPKTIPDNHEIDWLATRFPRRNTNQNPILRYGR